MDHICKQEILVVPLSLNAAITCKEFEVITPENQRKAEYLKSNDVLKVVSTLVEISPRCFWFSLQQFSDQGKKPNLTSLSMAIASRDDVESSDFSVSSKPITLPHLYLSKQDTDAGDVRSDADYLFKMTGSTQRNAGYAKMILQRILKKGNMKKYILDELSINPNTHVYGIPIQSMSNQLENMPENGRDIIQQLYLDDSIFDSEKLPVIEASESHDERDITANPVLLLQSLAHRSFSRMLASFWYHKSYAAATEAGR